MIILARIKLTKPWLGDQQPDRNRIRRFKRNGHLIKVNDAMWRGQFRQAANDLHMVVSLDALRMPSDLIPASIHLYTRTYSQVKLDYFESFRKGTVLNIEFQVNDTVRRAPTLEQFDQLLGGVGKWLGLSPWGNQYGYGTFDVQDIINYESTTIQNSDQPAGERGPETGAPDGHGSPEETAG
jgi:hypothetical protein